MTRLMTELTHQNGQWTLKLYGDINARTSPTIWGDEIIRCLLAASAQRLVIDLVAVAGIDAYGLRFLLKLRRALAQYNIQVVLQNPGANLRKLFKILRFDDAFEIKMVH